MGSQIKLVKNQNVNKFLGVSDIKLYGKKAELIKPTQNELNFKTALINLGLGPSKHVDECNDCSNQSTCNPLLTDIYSNS